jgi:hypothetical protein
MEIALVARSGGERMARPCEEVHCVMLPPAAVEEDGQAGGPEMWY